MLAGAIRSVSPVATLVETGDICIATPKEGGGEWGGGKSAKVYTGRPCPRSNPLPPRTFPRLSHTHKMNLLALLGPLFTD